MTQDKDQMTDDINQKQVKNDAQFDDDEIVDKDDLCALCDDEEAGCGGCGKKKGRADTVWFIIAIIVILLIAILLRPAGGT